jgi:hypothetical protein
MPGQRSGGRRRTRGSWTPRIVGLSLVVLLAAGGAAAALIARTHAPPAGRALPTRVRASQPAGLVNPGPPGRAAPQMLLASAAGLVFRPVPRRERAAGNPQWTADTMVGGGYIFIYAPNGQCLAAESRALVLRRCDLRRNQRWRGVGGSAPADGHRYAQLRNLAVGRCIAAGAAGPGGRLATLAPCARAGPWRQLISLWWTS